MVLGQFVVAQPQPTAAGRRQPLAPSLLSDPAFSADPQAHPYFVTGLSTPPVGHPNIKRKSRRARPIFATDDKTLDSETEPFHLIQPPNSPANAEGPTASTYFGISQAEENREELSASQTASSSSLNTRSPAAAVHISTKGPSHPPDSLPPPSPPSPPPPPPPVPSSKAERSSFMTFLSRRKPSQKPEEVPPPPPSTLSKTRKEPPRAPNPGVPAIQNDVTRPPAPRHITEPTFQHVERPVLPARPATVETGADLVAAAASLSASNGSTAAKRRTAHADSNNVRMKDLDRIDELDETNFWGMSLHHEGPYEAAIQAIRRPEKSGPLAFANSTYHQRAMQAHGNNYVPPQAPIGSSLKLSPGQILPRNFAAQYGNAVAPQIRDAAPPITAAMMLPPSSKSSSSYGPSRRSTYQAGHSTPLQASASLPSTSRRQSFQTSTMHTPMHDFNPLPTAPSSLPSRRQSTAPPSNITTPLPNPHQSLPPPERPPRIHPPLNATTMTPMPNTQPLPPAPANPPPPPIVAPVPNPVSEGSRSPPNGESERPVRQQHDFASIGIGMAMLGEEDEEEEADPAEPEASSNPHNSMQPRVYAHQTTSGGEARDFDPYDPSHLEIERHERHEQVHHQQHQHQHQQRRGREAEQVAGPGHEGQQHPVTEALHDVPAAASNVTLSSTPPDSRTKTQLQPPQERVEPAYGVDVKEQGGLRLVHQRDPTAASDERGSPPPYAPPLPDKGWGSGPPRSQAQQVPPQGASRSQSNSRNGSPNRQVPIRLSEEGLRAPPPPQVPTPEHLAVPDRHHNGGSMTPPTPHTPSRRSPDRPERHQQRPGSIAPSQYEDARSTHPSLSTQSSSALSRMGPPPPRHLPKRLVMPAPLAYPMSPPNANRMSQLPPSAMGVPNPVSPPSSSNPSLRRPQSMQQGQIQHYRAPRAVVSPPASSFGGGGEVTPPGMMSPPSMMSPPAAPSQMLPPQSQPPSRRVSVGAYPPQHPHYPQGYPVHQQQYPNPPPPPRQMQMPPPQAQMQTPTPMPMQPVHNIVRPQAQDIQRASSKVGKLKKRVSMIGGSKESSTGGKHASKGAAAPPPPPVLTTVSFAPPIIGFDRSVGVGHHVMGEKGLQRAMTEKGGGAVHAHAPMHRHIASVGGTGGAPPKRLLSKRR